MVGQKRPLISYLWPYFWIVSFFQGRGERERRREVVREGERAVAGDNDRGREAEKEAVT